MTQLSLSSLNDTVELQGTLERVVFHNEENGYTVFRVRPEGKDEVDLVTVVGHMGSPQAGASLRIKGRWVNNARFGRQVQMDSFESLLPATAEGIKLYLASGLIKGIGKSIAARIVKAFGEDTLRIFDEEPQRLLRLLRVSKKLCLRREHRLPTAGCPLGIRICLRSMVAARGSDTGETEETKFFSADSGFFRKNLDNLSKRI